MSEITTITNKYLELLQEKGIEVPYISGQKSIDHTQSMAGHIERFIGYTQVPTGLAGPISIKGLDTKATQHYIPMATTEGALVASYNRGLKACELSGGITSVCIEETVQRSPFFKLEKLSDALHFGQWVKEQFSQFQKIVSKTSRFAELKDVQFLHEGNSVTVTFEYTTGAAAGQNMTTIATAACFGHILHASPYTITESLIESNFSGDKKGNSLALSRVRGKKVIAEMTLNKETIKDVLKSTPELIVKVWQAGT